MLFPRAFPPASSNFVVALSSQASLSLSLTLFSGAVAQQRRHFLRGRWVDPTDSEDMGYFNSLQRQLTPQQAVDAEKVLVDFSRWKPGPAGRGGERVCRKRDSISDGMSDEDESSEAEEMPSNKRRMVTNQPGHVQKRVSAGSSAGGVDRAARRVDKEEEAGPGLLEMLCMVASSVEHVSPSRLKSPSTSEDSDKFTEEEAAESTVGSMEASNARPHLHLPVAFSDAISASLVTGKLEVSAHKETSAAAAAPAVEAQNAGEKEAEHVVEVSVTSGASHDDSSPAFVASTRRSAADEDDVQQRGRPAESADTRGSWDSAGTHDSDVSLSPSDSPESRQASSAAHDVDADDATAGGEVGAAAAMTCAERMAASQHQAAGATARSSCARRMAAASVSPPRHALQEVPITRAVEPAVPAPFANLFRSSHIVDEGMSRYPIGR